MTNATTAENNSTNYYETNKEKCNQTSNNDEELQKCIINTLRILHDDCSNNTNNNSSDLNSHCAATNKIKLDSLNNTKENEIQDKDTVLKYVYKKGDKAEIPIKDKGHIKNSLRRKRATNELHSRSPLPSKFQKPITVNYETLHGPREVEPLAPLRNTENKILGADLADFNIETVHQNTDANSKESIAPKTNNDSSEEVHSNEASNERNNNRNSLRNTEDSRDSGEYKNRKSQSDNDNSGEDRDYQNRKPTRDSSEREDYKTSKSESDESGERGDYRNPKSSRENDNSAEHTGYKNRQSGQYLDTSGERSHERGESGNKNDKYRQDQDDSGERGNYQNKRNGSGETYSSAESNENNRRPDTRPSSRQINEDNSDSGENRKNDPNSAESQESAETGNKNLKSRGRDYASRTNEKYLENDRTYETPNQVGSHHRKGPELSNENSNESNESKETKLPQKEANSADESNQASPAPIREIDLDDFSYERVNVNNDGKVEPLKDNLELVDPKQAVEILPLSTATPDTVENNDRTLNSLTEGNAPETPKIEGNENKLIQIDDGEVKPVVEINPEKDSESSEENNKSNVSDEVESLESILGVKEPEIINDKHNDQNDKIVEQKAAQDGDVKQEFERIPLNYNHAKKSENENSQTEAPKDATEETPSDGTLDVFIPDIKYDEHLKIKFDDVSIKLPDIKLPDDILAYTRDGSPYGHDDDDDDKKKNNDDISSYNPSYYRNYADRGKSQDNKNAKEDDDDSDDNNDDRAPRYYGYHGDDEEKQQYKKKDAEANEADEESDEDEDLYEKFVRERFGKRGTFEKRSEKLEAMNPVNPELYKTIKHILKKTADIDEQAKKSGDPNAGYMWTLEYGEKL
ncbi:hypothetical protein B5X24_HaOG213013 [Helicoverpa armigera]|nr:hypothetical protein B5X24_HaOG213013 [Helicoverpa armigera]